MKKIFTLFILFVATQIFAQTNGITYQAVILNPNGEQLPGVNNSNSPLVNKDICMVFKFVDEFSNIEYQETIQTKTDQFGMVNLLIGSGTQTGGYALSFQNIVWNSSKKSLIVGINISGNCSTYTVISNQQFSYVPLAFSAINAENVTGVIAIENGGTNATTLLGARTNLGINNIDNTSDLNKPISIATQTSLNLKEDVANKSIDISMDANSDTKYPSVKSVKTYVDAAVVSSSTAADLTNEINRATLSENTIAANLVTEINNRISSDNTLTTDLATEVTNRTAADLLKEDVANKSIDVTTDGVSDTKYPSVKSVKTYVDATAATTSSALTNEITRATTAENAIAADLVTETNNRISSDNTLTTDLATETTARTIAEATLTTDLATEVTNRTAADLLKEDVANKSIDVTTDGVSDTKYPSVKSVKTYVDATAATTSTALTNEITRATTAENAIAADLVTETNNRISSDNILTTDLATETTARTIAEATLTTDLATEVTNRTAADLLKEDVANKSIDVTTDGVSDTKYPSVKSVKTYVDAAVTSASTDLTNEINRATSAENTIAANLAIETTARNSGDVTLQTNIDAVQADVDANEADVSNALNLKAPLDSPALTGTPTAPTALAGTNTTQIATTGFVTDAISTSGSNFLPLTGGTLSGTLNGVMGDFSSNFKVASLTLNGTSIWEFVTNGSTFNLAQGGCCNRLTIDGSGRFGIGANYTPSYQLDVEGDGRFTSSVTATSFIKSGGTSSQFLKADGSVDSESYAALVSPALTGTPTAPTATAGTNTTQIATTEFVTNAISSATTGSFVDLTTNQTIAGNKTFSSNLGVNGITVGTNGSQSLIIGDSPYSGTDGNVTAVGFMALNGNSGANNTAFGSNALRNSGASSYNTAVGLEAGSGTNTGGYNTLLGYNAKTDSATPSITNAVAIGNEATVDTSNTIQLGNSAITNVKTSGTITAGAVKYTNTDGSSGQVLTTNGSGQTSWTTTQTAIEVADEFFATASQTSFTLTQTPSVNSKVKMYVNGIRISNTAYSWTGTTITYNPANNGFYVLTVNDRIQFDYFY